MKRAALYIGFPYTAGLLIASVVHWQLWYGVFGAVLLTALVLLLCRRAVWKYVLISTLSILTACCLYWEHDARTAQRQLPLAGQENTVFSGEITAVTVHDSGYASYLLSGTLNGEIPANIQYFCDVPYYACGDTLILTGTPEPLENTYVFSAKNHYRSQNVFLSMPLTAEAEHIPRTRSTLRSVLYEWRQEMTERMQENTDAQTGAFMTGLLFGDKSAMTGSTKTTLYRTGIGHVMAVSGLHLDFLALCVVWLLRKCKADRRLSFALLALLALLFVICVGETVSVKRACIMILISQSAGLFFRRADMLNSISIAMLLLTLENPFVIHSAAFWLSFSGAFGIGVFAPYMVREMPKKTFLQKELRQFAAMCCVFLAVLPASMLYFREISLISPLSNLLLVPVCMLVLLLEALALLTGMEGMTAEWLLGAAEWCSELVLRISAYLAELPWTYADTDSAVMGGVLAVSAALLLCCYFLWKSRRLMCTAIACSLLTACIAAGTERMYRDENLHIAVLGESRDCVLVLRSGREAVIIDLSGDTSAPDHVGAYLQSSGVRSISSLFLCTMKEKTMTKYGETLRMLTPEQVVAMETPEELTPFSIAGKGGEYAIKREILFHGAVISVTEDTVQVSYPDFTYVCCKEKTADLPECEALTIYGTSKNVLPECGILMVLDGRSCYTADSHTYVGMNQLELAVTHDGKCSVRSLYADT